MFICNGLKGVGCCLWDEERRGARRGGGEEGGGGGKRGVRVRFLYLRWGGDAEEEGNYQ